VPCGEERKPILEGNETNDHTALRTDQAEHAHWGTLMVASRFFRPSRTEFFEMMAHLRTYSGTGAGAEQDFLTDFWKTKEA
jgi:hypothetical protein